MKKIDFFCERLPIPGSSGAQSYNYSVVRAMCDNGYAVNIIVSGDYFERVLFRDYSKEYGLPVTVKYVWAFALFERVVVFSIRSYFRALRKFLPSIKKNGSDKRKVGIGRFTGKFELWRSEKLFTDDVDVLAVDTIFRSNILSLYKGEGRKFLICHDIFHKRTESFNKRGFISSPSISLSMEVDAWKKFDVIAAINSDDGGLIKSLLDCPCIYTIYPSVEIKDDTNFDRGDEILYVGANAHHNIDGLRWFFSEVWPGVRKAHPRATLNVVGSICESFSKAPEGVSFLGRVDNIELVSKRCRFSINPVFMGSGIKIKNIDYLSLGLPIITTTIGGYGFPKDGDLPYVLADSALEFQDAIVEWLIDPDVVEKYSTRCRSVLNLFSRSAVADTLGLALNRDKT